MEKQWEKSSSNDRSNDEGNEERSFQSIGKESRGDQDDDLEESGQDQDNNRADMDSNGQNKSLSNMAYNWVSFVQHKAKAVKAYEQYISDAEEAGETECAELFRKACKADLEQLGQARNHLSAVLRETENAE
ncbi:hypothetical protein EV673_2163 [Limnobacter thiooxidans]|uniref:Uncharacterized protein n=1 Tax=Limnobacter thiooxidans TaxID=131080 RepID=A0AA86J194_9BURK|nr:hypothetical protein EV673_2163 [Limnobacter thiooxidans]BET27168.1 hypothetical protein RGQ30_26690 [Limnobacter thiooxidans]